MRTTYGGSGSGRVRPQDGQYSTTSSTSAVTDIATAFKQAGVEVNQDILDFYSSYATLNSSSFDINTLNFNRDTNPEKFNIIEPNINSNSKYKNLLDAAPDFSDVAIVTISRQGGESEDMPEVQYKSDNGKNAVDNSRHYLQVTTEEEALLRYASENFGKVIVLINSTNTFQLDFLDSIPNIKACLVVGATGLNGAEAIPNLIFGDATPSGHLVDTQAYDFTKYVATNYCGYEGVSFFKNFNSSDYGYNQTTNAGVKVRPSAGYVDYIENIYVGYRWYETADVEGAFKDESITFTKADGTTNTKTGYDAVVQYPFGYGLSYTNFSWTIVSISSPENSEITADTDISIDVMVTNTGDVKGKDVVELYMTPQYNKGGIEKSAIKLVDYAKTEDIEPGKNETVTLHAKARDFASYDCYDMNKNGKTTWEVDAGTYQLKLMKDSHNISKVSYFNGSKKDVDGIINYKVSNTLLLDTDPSTGYKISNLFTGNDAVDGVSIDGQDDGDDYGIKYIKRDSFSTLEYPIAQKETHTNYKTEGRALSDNAKKYELFNDNKARSWNEATDDEFGNPINITDDDAMMGMSGDLTLYDDNDEEKVSELGYKLGKDYDDKDWDTLLSQVKFSEAVALVNRAHNNTNGIKSIGLYCDSNQNYILKNWDGPAQVGAFAGDNGIKRGTGFPCATTLGQTWNKNLAYEQGLSMGNDMRSVGITSVYGPGMNIHRNPFGGRNYEYFSEDPVLVGNMAGELSKGIKDTGCVAFAKHLVAAETETSRDGLYTWMTEQTLREIYLEPFRIAIEDYGVNGLMTSYNRVGALWAGGSHALMEGVIRNEFGFKGVIFTDYSDNNQYMNLDETLRCQGDLGMSVALSSTYSTEKNASDRFKVYLKLAVKHTAYAYLSAKCALKDFKANPYKGKTVKTTNAKQSFNWVTPAVVDINILVLGGAVLSIFFGTLGGFNYKEEIDILKRKGE